MMRNFGIGAYLFNHFRNIFEPEGVETLRAEYPSKYCRDGGRIKWRRIVLNLLPVDSSKEQLCVNTD
jgi:microcystin degradation protein MlrC